MRSIKEYSLYLVISEECCLGRSALEVAERAIAGGVDIVQMREKNKSLQELVSIGKDFSALCRSRQVTFIVNDDPALARRVGADGVHLGQEDVERFSIEMARDAIGPDKVIGISTHSLQQLAKTLGEDVDYVAFGPVFPTRTKDYHIGTGDIREVMRIARKPVFFIGGMNLSSVDTIFNKGGRNIAMMRGVTEADDITTRVRVFKERLTRQAEAATI